MSEPSADSECCCRRVIFHGRVQGVGFRYTTQRIAARFPVSGFVKNLSDGTVELVAAGNSPEVEAFLDQVAGHFDANITELHASTIADPGDLGSGLTIRH